MRPVKPVTVMAYVSQLGKCPLRKESGMFIWLFNLGEMLKRKRKRKRKKRGGDKRGKILYEREGALKMARKARCIYLAYSSAAI